MRIIAPILTPSDAMLSDAQEQAKALYGESYSTWTTAQELRFWELTALRSEGLALDFEEAELEALTDERGRE